VFFHDPVPKTRVPQLLAAADVGLMSLFRSPLAHIYFENKLIDYLGAALPVVAAMDGIQGEILRVAGAGVSVPSHDDAGMALALTSLVEDRAEAERMGCRGRDYVRQHFLQSTILEHYAGMLERVARGEAKLIAPYSPFE
jgi:glycosyltransferase involved in cell wall biosynthesis